MRIARRAGGCVGRARGGSAEGMAGRAAVGALAIQDKRRAGLSRDEPRSRLSRIGGGDARSRFLRSVSLCWRGQKLPAPGGCGELCVRFGVSKSFV